MPRKKNNESSLGTSLELLEVIGAREHNLKNIDIAIPKNKLVVLPA